jgi:hypothetical protein
MSTGDQSRRAHRSASWPTSGCSRLRAEDTLETPTINECERVLGRLVMPRRRAASARAEPRPDRHRPPGPPGAEPEPTASGKGHHRRDARDDRPARRARCEPGPASREHPPPTAERRSLALDDLPTVRTAVEAWAASDRPGPGDAPDLADVVDVCWPADAWVGEVLALRWSDIDLEAGAPTRSITAPSTTSRARIASRSRCPDGGAPRARVVLLHRRHRGRTASVPSSRRGTALGSRSPTSNRAGVGSGRTGGWSGWPLMRSAGSAPMDWTP